MATFEASPHHDHDWLEAVDPAPPHAIGLNRVWEYEGKNPFKRVKCKYGNQDVYTNQNFK
jgi:hypothetical protein